MANDYFPGQFSRRQIVKGQTMDDLNKRISRMKDFKMIGKPIYHGFQWTAVMEYEGDKKNGSSI